MAADNMSYASSLSSSFPLPSDPHLVNQDFDTKTSILLFVILPRYMRDRYH